MIWTQPASFNPNLRIDDKPFEEQCRLNSTSCGCACAELLLQERERDFWQRFAAELMAIQITTCQQHCHAAGDLFELPKRVERFNSLRQHGPHGNDRLQMSTGKAWCEERACSLQDHDTKIPQMNRFECVQSRGVYKHGPFVHVILYRLAGRERVVHRQSFLAFGCNAERQRPA